MDTPQNIKFAEIMKVEIYHSNLNSGAINSASLIRELLSLKSYDRKNPLVAVGVLNTK